MENASNNQNMNLQQVIETAQSSKDTSEQSIVKGKREMLTNSVYCGSNTCIQVLNAT